eukprot:CAMPEP_0172637252 /NCGR_PEP_ID=MMETSP1068-20121228/207999_1 /TAXON_ID=35684 /ORGANISM="Pseudopedinella elastica, Strain CCMP716" /LENGTH=40 /DNA_ID= /DNA_START= /DNA_END= /DNA_ORIENTATION=
MPPERRKAYLPVLHKEATQVRGEGLNYEPSGPPAKSPEFQ